MPLSAVLPTAPSDLSLPGRGCQKTTGTNLAPTALNPEEVKCMAPVYGFVSHTHGDAVPSELL